MFVLLQILGRVPKIVEGTVYMDLKKHWHFLFILYWSVDGFQPAHLESWMRGYSAQGRRVSSFTSEQNKNAAIFTIESQKRWTPTTPKWHEQHFQTVDLWVMDEYEITTQWRSMDTVPIDGDAMKNQRINKRSQMCCLVFHYEFKHVETIDLLPAWCPKSHRSVFRAVTHTHSTKVQSRGQQSWRPPNQEVYDRRHRAKGRRTYPRFTFGRVQEQSILVRRYSSWFMLSVAQNILHSDTAGRWTEGDVDSAFSPRSLRQAISTNIHQQIHGLKQLLSSQTKQLPTKKNPHLTVIRLHSDV